MKSYILAIAFSMLLSAVYAFQNGAAVTVRFLFLERTMPQGIWEVLLFAAGVVLMWITSLFALMEVRGKLKAKVKALEERVSTLEEEKRALMGMGRSVQLEEPAPLYQEEGQTGTE